MVWQVAGVQSVHGQVAYSADLLIGAGVIVACPDEPATLFTVDRYLVAVPGQPEEDTARLAELVAEISGNAGWRCRAVRIGVRFGENFLSRRWTPGRE